MSGQRRPVAADVARAVGVSTTTVSYVFSDTKRHKISPATVEKVLREAERVGFRPNRTAAALRTGKRTMVVAVIPDWEMGPTWSAMLQTLNDHIASRGYALSAVSSEANITPPWGDLTPGAVIPIGDLSPELAELCKDEGIAVVDAGVPRMLHRAGMTGAAALHASGFERLAYLLPAPPFSRAIIDWVHGGVVQYCRENGLIEPLRGRFDPTPEGTARMRAEWLESTAAVDGIVAQTDEIGTFFYLSLRAAGFDTSTIGMVGAGDRPISHLGLSTITSELGLGMARRMAEAATDALARGGTAPVPVIWSEPTVLYRDSLRPPVGPRAASR